MYAGFDLISVLTIILYCEVADNTRLSEVKYPSLLHVAVLNCRVRSCLWETRLTFGQSVTVAQVASVESSLWKMWTSVATSIDG